MRSWRLSLAGGAMVREGLAVRLGGLGTAVSGVFEVSSGSKAVLPEESSGWC